MNKNDKVLFAELVREDNIGLVLRGHLHVERKLIAFISRQLLYPERIDWGKIDYTGKVELALSCGLEVDIRPALEHLQTLRNNFAHSLNAKIEPNWVLVAYNGLPRPVKDEVEAAYKALGKQIGGGAATLDTRDLLVLVFICVANAVQAELNVLSKVRAKAKKTVKKRN